MTKQDLENRGLRLANVNQLLGTIGFEAPVSISNSSLTGEIHIGNFTYMGSGCRVIDANIGRFCSIARDVNINMRDHPTGWLSTHPFQYDGTKHFQAYDAWSNVVARRPFPKKLPENRVHVGNDVWIGERAMITSGVRIGDGAIIATGSVVTHDVPDYTIVGGVPARPIRLRFDESTVARLQSLQWWKYDFTSIRDRVPWNNIASAIDIFETAIDSGDIQPVKKQSVFVKANRNGFSFVE